MSFPETSVRLSFRPHFAQEFENGGLTQPGTEHIKSFSFTPATAGPEEFKNASFAGYFRFVFDKN